MKLADFRNIPFMGHALDVIFPNISDIQGKAERLVEKGDLLRLRRGLYVVNPKLSGNPLSTFAIANHIYGPSYISMQSALRFYGLIPETVYETISVTPKTTRIFENSIGRFRYIHCEDKYYSVGITSGEESGAYFLIATAEKALCDLIVFTPNLNLRYRKEMMAYLQEDLRLDMDEVTRFDIDLIKSIQKVSRKKHSIELLIKIIEDERNV